MLVTKLNLHVSYEQYEHPIFLFQTYFPTLYPSISHVLCIDCESFFFYTKCDL